MSVIMPAYNAGQFVEAAISSVLSQSMQDWELIVIDDCSGDGTYEIARKYDDPRIRVLQNDTNSGVAKTRNRGLDLAKGKYIAFLDSDDIWHPRKLACQLQKIEEENAQLCYCSYAIIGASGERVRADYIVREEARFADILKENYMQCSAMLIQADVAKKHRFNTEFFHEDYILGLDILKDGNRAVGCKEILLNWRYLENSRSFNKKKSAGNRWKIYTQYLHLPIYRSAWLFAHYALAGLRKYFRKP